MTLKFGPLGETTMHLCVDMQRLFAEETEWHTPWMERVLPMIVALTERRPAHTAFTRFIPLRDPEEGHGTWRRYYERWPKMTLNELPDGMIDLMPALQTFAPPAGSSTSACSVPGPPLTCIRACVRPASTRW